MGNYLFIWLVFTQKYFNDATAEKKHYGETQHDSALGESHNDPQVAVRPSS